MDPTNNSITHRRLLPYLATELVIMIITFCWENWHREEMTVFLSAGSRVVDVLKHVITKNPTGNRSFEWSREIQEIWRDNLSYIDFSDRKVIPPFLKILEFDVQKTYITHWNSSFEVYCGDDRISFIDLLNSGAFGLIHHMLKTGHRFELEPFKTSYELCPFIMPRFHHDVLTDDEKILIAVSTSVLRQYQARKKDYFFNETELRELLQYLAPTCGKNYNPIWIMCQVQLMTCYRLDRVRGCIRSRELELTRKLFSEQFPDVYDFEEINPDEYMYLCKYCLEKPFECRCFCTSCRVSVNNCTCYCFKCNSRLRPCGYGLRFEKEEEVMEYTICECYIPLRGYSLWLQDSEGSVLQNLFS
jgi:hypothetical protein